MIVNELKEICEDHSKWKAVFSAYPSRKRGVIMYINTGDTKTLPSMDILELIHIYNILQDGLKVLTDFN